jgi:serine/threonine-protein kinase
LADAFRDRYLLERELGRGGMATVYLARDLKHDRQVALKLLRPELAHELGPDRFLREIRLAARLQNPHILPLHDSGESAGLLWYTMPWIQGGSLRDRLHREGQLPIPDALAIARDVLAALAYAHEAGVVHRDIKPENILLADAVALVADFGIARAVEAAGAERLTETGLALGTSHYMSPEQAAADRRLDGRSDIYSAGCVVYEMLAGQPPFTGSSSQAVAARHALDPVPALRTVRPLVPEHVELAIAQALAKTPADRFASAAQFAAALAAPAQARRKARAGRLMYASALGAVTLLAGAWLAWRPARAAPSPLSDLKAVAVLPFRNLGDSADAYFVEGLTEELNSALVGIEGLAVRPHAAVAAQVAGGGDLVTLGRRLDAAYLVDGSVRRMGERLRVTVQLVRVDGQVTAWSRPFDVATADLFAIQDSIASQVTNALSVRLSPVARSAIAGRGTSDGEAYNLYLRGKYSSNLTLEGTRESVTLYQRAIGRDSNFALPWAGLAEAYGLLAQLGGRSPSEIQALWRQAAERAIRLDSLNGDAYGRRGQLRFKYDWDFPSAERDFQRAIQLSPGSADPHLAYAQFLNAMGRDDSALVEAQRAVAFDSTDTFLIANLAGRYWFLGRYEEHARETLRALAIDSTQWVARWNSADQAVFDGRGADAALEADRMRRDAGDVPLVLAFLPCYYVAGGRRPDAVAVLTKLEELERSQYVQAVYIAHARLCLGDEPGALEALELSERRRDLDLVEMLGDGYFRRLRGQPRYEALVERIGLPKRREAA